ncbi:hypothetical protein FMM67_00005, partial [Clostridium sp. ASF356]|nr:hypothetical protein [Clostridium sp. MD294]
MGTENEQHSSESGGNRQTGNDIHLEQSKNGKEQRGSQKLPQFIHSYPKEIVLGCLEQSVFLKKDWQEIVEYFQYHTEESERTEFIKTVYKNETLQTDINSVQIGFEYHQNGLFYWSENKNNKISQSLLPWDFIQKAVSLILKYQIKNRDITNIEQQTKNIEKAEQQQSSAFFVAEKNVEQMTLDILSSQEYQISTEETEQLQALYIQQQEEKNEPLQQSNTEENNKNNNDILEPQQQVYEISTEETEQPQTLYVQHQQENNEPLQQHDIKQSNEENNESNTILQPQQSQIHKIPIEETEQSQTLYIQPLQQKSEQLLQYDDLKQKYTDYFIGVDIEGFYQFYGKDAESIAEQLDRETIQNIEESIALKTPLSLDEVKIVLQKQKILLTDKKEYIPLINEIEIDNQLFKWDSIDFKSGTISLLDTQVKGWFPLFRNEKISFVREQIENQFKKVEEKQTVNNIGTQQKQKTENINFHITDDFSISGGKKTKYQQNVAAIHLLKELETENKLANTEQQQILSKYVGWGGLVEAFDSQNGKWAKEYAELKELLSPEEYKLAKASTLNAHYTNTVVIKAMYQAIENMDLPFKNVLEPSCGIGNFFGLAPQSLKDVSMYG